MKEERLRNFLLCKCNNYKFQVIIWNLYLTLVQPNPIAKISLKT